ncbi:hypothetical protein PFISCL1PPCAC_14834, partial [Pristionchus fissidentatus]
FCLPISSILSISSSNRVLSSADSSRFSLNPECSELRESHRCPLEKHDLSQLNSLGLACFDFLHSPFLLALRSL